MVRKVNRGGTGLLLAVALLGGSEGSEAQLRGDTEAVAAVARMIEALGGAELWVAARTLELDYRARSKSVEGVVVERAWRDLTRPEQRIEIEHSEAEFAVVATETNGWRIEDGRATEWDRDAVARHRIFWPKDFYTLLRRLAVGDPDLWVEQFGEDEPVIVFSESMGELGWWDIADDGDIERWGTVDQGEPLAYVYGPIRDFGDGLRLPAWGASLDGSWRFEYTRAALRATGIDPLQLTPPG